MNIETEKYIIQKQLWPREGRHILAHYDKETIIVYQAYGAPIGEFALAHGYLDGPFKYTRMTWIKPNFLWMMYRCGWGMKEGQVYVLAIRLTRRFFDFVLSQAVESSYRKDIYADEKAWKTALRNSHVRLQWDPDHGPSGNKVTRRAIQLGLRNQVTERYGRDEILEIIDMREFVKRQRENLCSPYDDLLLPRERVYLPADTEVGEKLGLSTPPNIQQ